MFERRRAERAQKFVIVERRGVGHQARDPNRVPEIVRERQLRQGLEPGGGREDRKLGDPLTRCSVGDPRPVPVQPFEQVVSKSAERFAVYILQDPRGTRDIQGRTRLSEPWAVPVDRLHIRNQEVIDQDLEQGAVGRRGRPHDLRWRRDHAIAAGDDRHISDATDVGNLSW